MTSRFAFIRLLLGAALLAAGLAPAALSAEKLDGRLRLLSQRAAAGAGYRPQDVDASGPEILVPVFLEVAPGVTPGALSARYPQARFSASPGRIITGRVPVSALGALASDGDILRAEAGTKQKPLLNVVKSSITSAGIYLGMVDPGSTAFGGRDGSGVIIGIVDSGVDFTHADFIKPGGDSRILFIWDQNDEAGAPGTLHPDGFAIGTEWTQAQINNEIDGTPAGLVRQTDTAGHGSHVLGIAGGNGRATDGDVPAGTFVGIAPDADLIVVNTTLFNTDIADGVQYIVNKAASLGKRAVVNLSLGSHSGPHDGTSSYETKIAAIASTVPVVVAMGNEAADSIHAATTIPADGEATFHFTRAAALSSMAAELWIPSGDLYIVTVSTAVGGSGAVTANPGQDASSSIGGDGIEITNSAGSHPQGDRQILVQVDRDPAIAASDIFIRLQRTANGASGRVDGWITSFADVAWANFVESSRTLSIPASAENVIAVGSYCSKRTWTADDNNNYFDIGCTPAGLLGDISSFSSLGPTRDGRLKPDVTAPGQRVASAQSKDNTGEAISNIERDGKHLLINGTSMAAPAVAGAAALALESDPDMTVEQFRTFVTSHARVDAKVSAHGSVPNTLWGYGKARIFGCGDVIVSTPSSILSNVVGTSSIAWSWSAVGGAADYKLYFADSLNPVATVSTTDYLQTALQPNSTVQLLVRGRSACGEGPGGASASTSTLALLAGSPAFTVFNSSISASFAPLPAAPRPASSFGYRLDASTAADFSGMLFSSQTPNNQNGTLVVSGLQSFTTYYLRLGTLNEFGGLNYALNGLRFTGTSLSPPGVAAFTNIGETAIRANWVLGGNPEGLEYIAHASTASDFTGTLLTRQTFDLFALFSGLTPNSRYHFRVRPTTGPFAALGFEETLSAVPAISTPAFTAVQRSSVSVAWLGGQNPAGTQYRAQLSPTADFSVSVVSSETFNFGASFTGLLGNTTYYMRVASLGIGGGVSAFTQSAASATLTAAPSPAAVPFAGAFASSVTVSWTALPVAPQDQSAVGYRVDASTSADFTGSLVSQFTFAPGANSLSVEGLGQDTTYSFRVGALNWQRIPVYSFIGSTRTTGLIISSDTVQSGEPLSLSVNPSFPEISLVRVEAPPNSFPAGTVLSINATLAPLGQAQSNQGSVTLLSSEIGVDINAGGAQPLKPVSVAFTYAPAQIPAGVDLDTLVIGRFDGDHPLWTLLPTVHDRVNKRLTATTDHFSVFSPLIVQGGNDFDAVQIFPVPWKAGSGDPRFDAQFISFTNLPQGAKLRVYTILGEFVWEATAPATGILLWNGKNRLGHDVGSGTYLAVFEIAGRRAVRRVVVVR